VRGFQKDVEGENKGWNCEKMKVEKNVPKPKILALGQRNSFLPQKGHRWDKNGDLKLSKVWKRLKRCKEEKKNRRNSKKMKVEKNGPKQKILVWEVAHGVREVFFLQMGKGWDKMVI
jgi:hypothetical protein